MSLTLCVRRQVVWELDWNDSATECVDYLGDRRQSSHWARVWLSFTTDRAFLPPPFALSVVITYRDARRGVGSDDPWV
jgi:hypothetical protein